MEEYGSSQFLQTIIHQENITNKEPPKFEANPDYNPQNIKAPGKKKKEEKIDWEIFNDSPKSKSEKKKIKQGNGQQTKPSPSDSPISDLPNIPPPPPGREYQHMIPIILGEIQEEDPKQEKTFLQALRQGNCIIQLPNKLPFHEIGKVQKNVEEVKGDLVQKQLKDYYDECYDSSGFLLQKQFTNLSNKANVGIHIGKILISQDGKALWKAGREEFEIVQGVNQNIDQKCLIVNKEDGNCDFINVGNKFVISPNY